LESAADLRHGRIIASGAQLAKPFALPRLWELQR
jgi:hypothetical protein